MRTFLPSLLSLLCLACASREPMMLKHEKRAPNGFWSGFSGRNVPNSFLETDGERLYFGSGKGRIFTYNAKNGKRLWTKQLAGSITSTPLADASGLYVGTDQGQVFRLDLRTGDVLWTQEVPGVLLGKPQSTEDGAIVLASNDGSLYAFEKADGSRVWRYRRDLPGRITIAYFGQPAQKSGNLIVGFWDGTLVALDSKTGSSLWEKNLERTGRFTDISSPVLLTDDGYATGQFFGQYYHFDSNGNFLWTKERSGTSANSIEKNGTLWIPQPSGALVAIEAKTGGEKWRYQDSKPLTWSGLVLIGKMILASSYEGDLVVIDAQKGSRIWTYRLHSSIQGPAVEAGDKVWVLTRKGRLFGFSVQNHNTDSPSRLNP